MAFTQQGPELGNQFTDDPTLRSYLKRVLAPKMHAALLPELEEMGELAGGRLYRMQLADRLNEPVLTQYDPWGRRIDHIELTAQWREAADIATRKGVVAAAYERTHGAAARIHQFALAYLFHASTDFYTCPLAMTDGAARALLASGNRELIDRAVTRLTSRDPERAWTSGQWMTETAGGSDVGRTETVARRSADGGWRLYGRKWFTSAATSRVALTLARPEGAPEGGSGLALFYVEPRDEEGNLRDVRILRLKDKLGTRKVPTAELMLDGLAAQPVAGLDHGVRNITPVLNITRVWNAIGSIATMRRGLALARDYAARREAFGKRLAEHPLHRDTLARLEAEFQAAFHLSFYVAELLGRVEHDEADESQQNLLRVLTPIAKLTTAKQAVAVTSEILEAFGGAGYVEDTGLPMLLRDAQVFPIWEGTTNVLALDTLRALEGAGGMELYMQALRTALSQVSDPSLKEARASVMSASTELTGWYQWARHAGRGQMEAGARRFALSLGRTFALALLLRHAEWARRAEGALAPASAARRFAAEGTLINPKRDADDSLELSAIGMETREPADDKVVSLNRRKEK